MYRIKNVRGEDFDPHARLCRQLVHAHGFSSAQLLESLGHEPGSVAAPLGTLKVAGQLSKKCFAEWMATLNPEGSGSYSNRNADEGNVS